MEVDEDDRDVAVGGVGEIVVRVANIMKGYWKDPELTAKALRGVWMHTGDLAGLDECGFIYIVDRENDMIMAAYEAVEGHSGSVEIDEFAPMRVKLTVRPADFAG